MSVTTVQSFSSMPKKFSEIFHFCDLKSFCVHNVMSKVIDFASIKILNNSATKSAIN